MVFFLYFFFQCCTGPYFPLTWPARFWILAHYFHLCHDMPKKWASSSLWWMLSLTISITAPLRSKKMFFRQIAWPNGFSERLLNVFSPPCLSGCFTSICSNSRKNQLCTDGKPKPSAQCSVCAECLCAWWRYRKNVDRCCSLPFEQLSTRRSNSGRA